MIKFNAIEDYIEVIAGDRDTATQKPTSNWISEPIISLARYDTDVILKMSTQTMNNIGYTEKQAKLAQKIILTYRRQLAQKNIDVSPAENPVYRLPIRAMDYSLRLYIEDDSLCLKFPYNQNLIDQIRTFGKSSMGRSRWNHDKKIWQVALTEYNINWLNTFAQMNNFEIDSTITDMVEKISQVEQADYKICLTIEDGNVVINNATDSLLQYIQEHVGDLHPDNLLKLIDYSGVLGYTVDNDIEEAIAAEYGYRFLHLITNRELKLDPTTMFVENNFDSIFDYAITINRLPVYVYEADLSGKLLQHIQDKFNDGEYFIHRKDASVPDSAKVVYITKPVREPIPLLVSSAGMIYGGEKELMIQRAEKIVYCAAEVYNKKGNSGVKSFAG
jgi:hypothetical protein